MAAVSRLGKTSASMKKASLKSEPSTITARKNLNDGRKESDKYEEIKKKNRFDYIYKLVIIGDLVSIVEIERY